MESLPNEVKLMIFNLLSTEDKIRLSCVCNSLRRLFLLTNSIHRNISFQHAWSIPGKAICKYISQNSKLIHSLNLQDCYWIKQAELIKCLNKCCELTSLNVLGCIISCTNMVALIKRLAKLQHLSCPLVTNSSTDAPSLDFGPVVKELTSVNFVINKAHVITLFTLPVCLRLPKIQSAKVRAICSNGSVYNEFYKHNSIDKTSHKETSKKDTNTNESRPCWPTRSFVCKFSAFKISLPDSLHHIGLQNMACKRQKSCGEHLEEVRLSCLSIQTVLTGEKFAMEWLFSRPSLKHISLTNVCASSRFYQIMCPDSSLLLQISSNILETIDLESCYLTKLDVLIGIVERCQSSLKHFNLLDTGRHGCGNHKTIRMLAKCSELKSLALNPCCLRTSHNRGSQEDVQETINYPLLKLVQSTRFVTEFELIGKLSAGITFWTEDNNRDMLTISSEQLESISQWKCLTALTLGGIQISGSSEFFIKICQSCTHLTKLSLANVKGPTLSHSGSIAHLNRALTFCHNLRDFRVEQPYFNITKAFLEAQQSLQQLERVCWKVRSGTLAEDNLGTWLDKCKKILCLIICCDVVKKRSKTLEKFLIERFKPRVPALMIAIYPYVMQNNDPFQGEQISKPAMTTVHFQEMAFLSSRVGKASAAF